ncbi:MAG: S53 family serine peptidase [Ktedonobacteraceae bacterium]
MSILKSFRGLLLSGVSLLALLGMLVASTLYLGNTTSTKAAGVDPDLLVGSASPWTKSASVHRIGHHNSSDVVTFSVLLSTSDAAGQQALVKSLYHQGSAYHQWLSTAQFDARFAPQSADVAAVKAFLKRSGMTLLASPDSTLVLASGRSSQIEQAFSTEIDDFKTPSGSYYGSTKDLHLPVGMGHIVRGVFGLSNMPVSQAKNMIDNAKPGAAPPPPYGGGPFGSGLTPSQIQGIYNINPVYSKLKTQGQGTTLAVYELSGYKSSDIVKYEDHYNLPHMNIVNVPVLSGATDDSGASEVELDIELQIAVAPKADKLLVYESPNTELGALAQYLQIAKDNKADSISTSWGIVCEYFVNSQVTLAENQIFLRMAAQGQSIFAASGDSGAYGCARIGFLPPAGQELQIGDPNNQPYITAVGGTSFQGPDNVTTFDPGKNPNPSYPGASKELPWTDGCDPQNCVGGATGGGVSRIWAEPDYAANLTTGQYFPGVIGPYSKTGAYCGQQPGDICRENPDISLDADPSTGYSIYCTDPGDAFCAMGEFGKPGWVRLGGTSCAAPVWAGIATPDISKHKSRLGLLNYIVYPYDSKAGYASQFHDIISAFTNGSGGNIKGQIVPPGYAANPGYDLETGVGTPDVYNFINS